MTTEKINNLCNIKMKNKNVKTFMHEFLDNRKIKKLFYDISLTTFSHRKPEIKEEIIVNHISYGIHSFLFKIISSVFQYFKPMRF